MASLPNDYYDGSRILSPISDYVGVSVDQMNFVSSQFAALALATLFRTVFHPSKTDAEIRHWFGLIVGLCIGYFCFGVQAIHLAGLPLICYLVMYTQNPQIMQRVVMAVALLYLSLIHIHRQVFDYGSYTLDITGPLMIITQKVTSLAFSIHDGLARKEEDLKPQQKVYAVKAVPTPLEYFSYVLQFQTLMAGPTVFYKDYINFIEGKNTFPSHQKMNGGGDVDNNSNSKNVIVEPSPLLAVGKKFLGAMLCAVVFVKFQPTFPIETLKLDHFVEKTTLFYKFYYLYIATTLVRFKYYHAWLFSDAICNNSGLGFNGYDEEGRAKWDRVSNIDIYKFELGSSLRESIDGWNIGTNKWLRMTVYDRVKSNGTLLTYALSALWHGFYPGYYLTFANGALFTFASRNVRRTIREYFTASKSLKSFYDFMTGLTTRLVMSYITYTFVLLEFWPGLRLYLHMYMCLHLAGLFGLFVVPRIIPRASKNHTKNAASNDTKKITQLIEENTNSITNGFSKHHD